ncbi:MAG: ABC-F family ATP-binding cassette domain-containing protein [Acidimicrobiales bacterium]
MDRYRRVVILVDVDDVTVTRPDRDLLRDVSLTVRTGDAIGVVGINGTGKSTLLRIIGGAIEPDSGVVRYGSEVSVAILDQEAPLPVGSVRQAVGEGWQSEAVLDRLGMTSKLDSPTGALSGGEARRVALAKVLVADSDLLILDEPTNHMDIGAIHWLEEWLSSYRGGLILISHDRHLLDRVTTRIVEMDRGVAHVHDGGYDSFLAGRADREANEARAETVRRSLARRELAWLRRGAPARTSKNKAHLERAVAAQETREISTARSEDLDLHVDVPRLGDKVIDLVGVGHRHGDERWLFKGLDLLLGRRERLGIVGLNGTGKTTLLDVMSGRVEPLEGRVEVGPTVRLGYHDQVGSNLSPDQRVWEAVTGVKRELDWQDKRLMERFWFDSDAQWAPIRLLSGGERRRLQLVLVLAERPNVLFLDEPTNDLDLDTLRALEDFLDEWPGTLVAVSHDRAFLERAVDDVLVLDGLGSAGRFPGGYAAWENQQRVRGTHRRAASADSVGLDRSGGKSSPKGRARTASGRSVSTIRHELKAADNEIDRLSARIAALETGIAESGADHERMRELGGDLNAAQQSLDATETRWLDLSQELEDR